MDAQTLWKHNASGHYAGKVIITNWIQNITDKYSKPEELCILTANVVPTSREISTQEQQRQHNLITTDDDTC